MNISDWVNVGFAVISVILFLISLFVGKKNKSLLAVAGLIYDAETRYGIGMGVIKMDYVVGKMYALIPAVFRPFIPRSLMMTIVQQVFDKIQAFGELQVKDLAKTTSCIGFSCADTANADVEKVQTTNLSADNSTTGS